MKEGKKEFILFVLICWALAGVLGWVSYSLAVAEVL